MKFPVVVALLSFCIAAALATAGNLLPITIGQATDSSSGSTYSITTDGRPAENSRSVVLSVTKHAETSTLDVATTLRTGKSQTVSQTVGLLREVFGKFLTGAPTGTVLGKLGSLDKGGEVLFVSASPEILRLIFKTPGTLEKNVDFTRADATNFLSLMAPQLKK